MTESEIKTNLKAAANKEAPKFSDRLITECESQPKGTVIVMTNKKQKKRIVPILSIAAAIALFLAVAFVAAGQFNRADNTVPTVIALDINPSLEIKLDKDDKVVEVVALNKDARTVIGDMDFAGSALDVTVNALIGSMLRNGFLSDVANSILISVDNENPEKAAALQQKLTEEIDTLLNRESFGSSVISQTVSPTDELKTLARQYGISVGKVKLINEMIQQNPLHTFEDLAPLSVNELKLIAENDNITLKNTQTSGTASDKAFIGAQAALEAAKIHADVSDVTAVECELDSERGILVYEVEFRTAEAKYEYDINAKDGTVVKVEKKTFNGSAGNNRTPNDIPTSTDPSTSVPPSDDPFIPATLITADTAKQTAFTHAGVNATDVWDLECELDHDDGKVKYEIDFNANGYEYEYDIEAYTGEILKSEKERDD